MHSEITAGFASDLEATEFFTDWAREQDFQPSAGSMGVSAQEVAILVAAGKGVSVLARSFDTYLKAKRSQIHIRHASGATARIDSTMDAEEIAAILESALQPRADGPDDKKS